MNRRSALLFAGVAGVGAAVGAGAFVWRQRQGASSGSSDTLWSQRFERPEGGELAMSAFRGRPLVLNFWATWCPPCVSELPLLDRSHRTQPAGGWQVVGLAVDKLGPVREFLHKHPVEFPVGLVGIDGIELARQLGNQGSALPFTVVFGRRGRIVRRKLGAIQPADLIDWEAEVR